MGHSAFVALLALEDPRAVMAAPAPGSAGKGDGECQVPNAECQVAGA